jgi:hypothetical protein
MHEINQSGVGFIMAFSGLLFFPRASYLTPRRESAQSQHSSEESADLARKYLSSLHSRHGIEKSSSIPKEKERRKVTKLSMC